MFLLTFLKILLYRANKFWKFGLTLQNLTQCKSNSKKIAIRRREGVGWISALHGYLHNPNRTYKVEGGWRTSRRGKLVWYLPLALTFCAFFTNLLKKVFVSNQILSQNGVFAFRKSFNTNFDNFLTVGNLLPKRGQFMEIPFVSSQGVWSRGSLVVAL